ncbi:MAG: ABC transporter ATP-binding protein [Steroidobacteraceae bacterium]
MNDAPDNIAEEAGNGAESLRELRRLWRYAGLNRWEAPTMFGLGIVTSCLDGLGISLVVLYLYAAIGNVDDIADSEGLLGEIFAHTLSLVGDNKLLIGSIVFALVATSSLLRFVYGTMSESISQRISERIRVGLHDQYLDVSYDYVRRHPPGTLLNLIESASWTVSDVTANLLNLAISVSTIVVFAGLLIATSWKFTLLSLAGFAMLLIGVRLFAKPAAVWGARAVEVDNALTQCTLVTLNCLRTIRVFGHEASQKQKFNTAARRVRDTFTRMERISEIATPISEIGHIALLCVFVGSATAFGISFAGSLAAVALLHRMRPHIQALEEGWIDLSAAHAKLRSLRVMLDRTDKTYLPAGHRPFVALHRQIRFDRVTLRYVDTQPPALDQVSFIIPAGALTAVVGASGAGKSTIVNLLLRLYRPQSGTIWIDDEPLDEFERQSWLDQAALAGQDVELMADTIAQNILMARPQATREELVHAAERAGILSFIESHPGGFDAPVGERGMSLSSGQRQRVGLARAFLRNPQILLLDEAMSALDGALEDSIRKNVERQFAGRTVILITHRLETVLTADHIICIDHGRIVEQGAPQELLSKPGGALRRMLHRGAAGEATAQTVNG